MEDYLGRFAGLYSDNGPVIGGVSECCRIRQLLRKRVATPVGLEPTTCRLEVDCSIQLSYGAETSLFVAFNTSRQQVFPVYQPG